MAVFPKWSTDSIHSLSKFHFFFLQKWTEDPKVLATMQKPQIAKTILKKKNVGLTLPSSRTYYKVTTVKTVWCCPMDKCRNQWDRTERAGISPHVCGQLTSLKGAKTIQGRKEQSFSKWCWNNWKSTWKRITLIPISHAKLGPGHQPLHALNHVPWQQPTHSTAQGGDQERGPLCSGKTGRTGLQRVIFRRFYEPNSCISPYLEKH